MAERHVEALFAPAYDGRLDDGQRRRFDDHLSTCDQCAAAFADHCAAGDALRSLPAARMPVPVRLPSHAPRPAHRSLRERLALQSGGRLILMGAGATAAVVVAAFLVLHNAQQNTLTTSGAEAVGTRGGAATGTSISSSSSSHSAYAAGAAPQFGGAGSATDFSNAVTVERSGRSGEVLVLATTQQSYAAGATVQVDARLVFRRASVATPAPVPGITQQAPPAAAAQPRAGLSDVALAPVIAEPVVSLLSPTSLSGAASGAAPSQAPIAIATSAGTSGFFQLTIPATARSGEVLTIVATVPAGVPSSADVLPVTAVLQITVA